MPISVQRDEPSVAYITPFLAIRIFAFVYLSPLLFGTAVLLFKLGFASFTIIPEVWWLLIMLVATAVFMVRVIFPPRHALPKVQIDPHQIRFVPSRMQRYMNGLRSIEAAITPQSREIILAHCIFEKWFEGDRIVVRGENEPDREIGFFGFWLNARDCRTLSEAITAAVGLPVRLVIRRRRMDGAIQESPWLPLERKANSAKTLATLAIGATPFIGGGVVGYFLPGPSITVAVGLVLWLGPILAISVYTRKRPTLTALSTVFTFGAAYGLAVVVVGYILRGH